MSIESQLAQAIDSVRASNPLVHSITNYVTVNDCANALLALGASPIMSDESEDVEDIVSICGGLVVNIGTLNANSVSGMHVACSHATSLGHPIVLDPVGAGASALRTDTASKILDAYGIGVVRGNMSEIKALAQGATSTRGVDVNPDDAVTDENIQASAAFARGFAARSHAIAAITGAIDVVADAKRSYIVRNGSPMQGRITGAGCMLSCLTGAFLVANPDDALIATLAAVTTMGAAGEIAQERMVEGDGNGSYRMYLLDALFNLDGATLASRARVEEA